MIFVLLLDLPSSNKDLILFLVYILFFINLFQIENYRNLKSIQVDRLSYLELKGILFSYYSETGNLVAYREMNL